MAIPNTTDDLKDLVGSTLTGQPPSPGAPAATYRLERHLGSGGQGSVFLARRADATGEAAVVVKIWRPSFVLPQPDVAGLVLRKEWAALARLNERVPPTPFVVRLLDGGEVQIAQRFQTVDLPWLALEHVHGGVLGTTLGERVEASVASTGHAFGPARARRMLGCIVEGVTAIHEAGIVHRDLKPSNVLVCGTELDELAKVADFGLARPMGLASTFGRLSVGTPGYAAPEQLSGESVGPWSDVFSLAAIAYYVIAGEDMFDGPPAMQMARAYAGELAPLPTRARVDPAWKASPRALGRIESVLRAARSATSRPARRACASSGPSSSRRSRTRRRAAGSRPTRAARARCTTTRTSRGPSRSRTAPRSAWASAPWPSIRTGTRSPRARTGSSIGRARAGCPCPRRKAWMQAGSAASCASDRADGSRTASAACWRCSRRTRCCTRSGSARACRSAAWASAPSATSRSRACRSRARAASPPARPCSTRATRPGGARRCRSRAWPR
jgi:serine/threonine protein kinase